MIDASLLPVSGVTRDELNQRAKRLGEALARKDISLAIIGYNPDLFYFTGSIQQGFVLISPEGEMVYCARKDPDRALLESPLETIVAFSRFKEIRLVIERFFGKVPGKIALSFDVMPVALFNRFKALLGKVEFVNGSDLVRSCRMIKSPLEVQDIVKGVEIYDKTIEQMPHLIREGMTEAEAEAALLFFMRRLGHHGMVRMRGWNQEGINGYLYAGKSSAVPTFLDAPLGGVGLTPAIAMGGGTHKIQRNEPIVFDASPGSNGYISDQTRTAVIGELSSRLEKAYHIAVDMIQRFETEAAPGDACSDWYLKLRDMARKAGLEDNFMGFRKKRVRYVGHGIGLELNEWPVLGEGLPWRLEQGMVLAVEPKMVFPEWGAVGIENDYLVTEAGVKRLSITNNEIITL